MNKNVGIDIQSTVGQKTGIGYYTANLIEEFKKLGAVDFFYYKDDSLSELNTAGRLYWENIAFPRLFRKNKAAILHVPGFAGPRLRTSVKRVTTVHDLIGIIYPENFSPVSRFYWQKWLPSCVKNSDFIIADSESTKKDLIELIGFPVERIRVIYLAAKKIFQRVEKSRGFSEKLKKYGINSRYILYIGTIDPRKNIMNLIVAFAEYLRKAKNQDISLVIVGKKAWPGVYEDCKRKVTELNLEEKTIFLDYIDEKDLSFIYNFAEVFVFPSFYEGFGLPVLEAMSCGVPVICSGVSSLPEITKDAAIFINPADTSSITNALKEVLSGEGLKEDLSRRSLERAKNFSWEKTAQQTLEVYKEALERR